MENTAFLIFFVINSCCQSGLIIFLTGSFYSHTITAAISFSCVASFDADAASTSSATVFLVTIWWILTVYSCPCRQRRAFGCLHHSRPRIRPKSRKRDTPYQAFQSVHAILLNKRLLTLRPNIINQFSSNCWTGFLRKKRAEIPATEKHCHGISGKASRGKDYDFTKAETVDKRNGCRDGNNW